MSQSHSKTKRYANRVATSMAAGGAGFLVSRGMTALGFAAGGPAGALAGAAAGAIAATWLTELLDDTNTQAAS